MRKFLGFTPDQTNIMLQQKGYKPNSREGVMYLAGMHDKAKSLVEGQNYQMGGQVGGFDPKSQKLFDAAVKRVSGNQPQTPEVQRYLDNVIETRGRPTMVFPGSADPLQDAMPQQGYQQGGPVKARQQVGQKVQVAGASRPIRQEELETAKQATLERPNPYGIQEPTGLPAGPDGLPITHSEATYFPGLNKVLSFNRETGQYSDGEGNFYEGKIGEEPTLAQYKPPPNIDFPRIPMPPPTSPRDKARTNLNTAQANLASQHQTLSDLQQELANLPTDASQDAKRQELVDKLTAQQTKIAQAEASVSSASSAFQIAAVPTTAEAVGTTVSTPSDLITGQATDLITAKSAEDVALGTGEVEDGTSLIGREGTAGTAPSVTQTPTALATTDEVAQDIRREALTGTTGTLSEDAKATAQQVNQQDLAVRDVKAAQLDSSVQVTSPAKRTIQQGEIISGAANADVARQFLEGVEAATGAPSSHATVQGQLTTLMSQFEGDTPPPWAAGAMRQATAIMAQRGLAASSMAGQAIVQAAMESSLPIAMQDAQTVARFEEQNLSNRQQRAMLAAQQRAQFLGMEFDQTFQARVQNAARIGDIANTNFSAEVQIALENARLAQTTDLTNIGNSQAVVMAQAAAIADADMANLSNRQQTEVRNAQAFLQMDMTNFNAKQQLDMFRNQSVIQGLFTDTAAQNAMEQFNATNQNQADQFFSKLGAQVSEFNVSQTNAMEQYNAGEVNALTKFQAQLNNQRDMFNAQNQLVIAQANAQWRQQLATINNAASNEANRQDALQSNALTQKGLDELWQRERDLMAYAFTSAENAENRRVTLMQSELDAEAKEDSAFSSALGTFAGAVVNGIFGMYRAT